MNNTNSDIYEMLDTLSRPVAAQRFSELTQSPELVNYTAFQFIREVLEPQYTETLNRRFETNLRLSSLINKGALTENLKTGNGRVYNDATVQQVLGFHFAENRQNVGIYGVTGAGKSYFISACCVEACRRNYRCKFVDYSDLLDELIVLNRQKDLNRYRKRIKYYARIQLLFIDDFAISREYSSEWKPGDEPYYPVNDEKNGNLYAEYKKLAEGEQKVVFGGRLGEYKYYDMDAVIASALEMCEKML